MSSASETDVKRVVYTRFFARCYCSAKGCKHAPYAAWIQSRIPPHATITDCYYISNDERIGSFVTSVVPLDAVDAQRRPLFIDLPVPFRRNVVTYARDVSLPKTYVARMLGDPSFGIPFHDFPSHDS